MPSTIEFAARCVPFLHHEAVGKELVVSLTQAQKR